MNPLRLSSDDSPILLANVFINHNWCAATIQRIAPSALRAGNPIILAGVHVVVVRLETCSLEALKPLTTVMKRATGLGKRDASNPPRSSQAASLALNIHDATPTRPGLLRRRHSQGVGPRRLWDLYLWRSGFVSSLLL